MTLCLVLMVLCVATGCEKDDTITKKEQADKNSYANGSSCTIYDFDIIGGVVQGYTNRVKMTHMNTGNPGDRVTVTLDNVYVPVCGYTCKLLLGKDYSATGKIGKGKTVTITGAYIYLTGSRQPVDEVTVTINTMATTTTRGTCTFSGTGFGE